MTPSEAQTLRLLFHDPARRRRLARRAGIEAARRGLRGPYSFRAQDGVIVASCAGQDVASIDVFEDAPRA